MFFFFFKQKTAYEIGTGDWSSDVCSSDLESATTLKYLYRQGENVVLKPANSNYEPMVYRAQEVDIQGRLLAVWRSQDLS